MLPLETSFVLATTYKVLLAGSITGEPVMPISGRISHIGPQPPSSESGTVVMPAAGLMKLSCHKGALCSPSASNA